MWVLWSTTSKWEDILRTFGILFCAACAVALVGCNNNPVTTYRIELDTSSLTDGNLPTSCFANSTPPQDGKVVNPSERFETVWTVWTGPSGTSYLDVGAFGETAPVKLGGASNPVQVLGAIESTDGKTFNGTVTVQNNFTQVPNPPANYSNTTVITLDVAFASTGGTATGTVQLNSQYTCSNCVSGTSDGMVSCGPVSVTFSGASVPTQPMTAYPTNAQ
jgi:hypothetical protein